jgi:hypothetical protein
MMNEWETKFLSMLSEKLQSYGFSPHEAMHCAGYFCDTSVSEGTGPVELPTLHPETLAEARRILAIHTLPGQEPPELDVYNAYCFLHVPESNWVAAKQTAAEVFGRSAREVDNLYNDDEYWLYVRPEAVRAVAAYLQSAFDDPGLIWALFRRAGLLLPEEVERRTEAVFRLLGREIGTEVIRADAFQCCWLFYGLYTDPVGAIAYMLERGMTPEAVLAMIQEDDVILYMFKERRTLSNLHFQYEIDRMIDRYLP